VRTACKGDLLGRRGDPSRERCTANLVPEPDHASNSRPAVLAEPAKDEVVRRYYDDGDSRLPPDYIELAIAAPRTWGGE